MKKATLFIILVTLGLLCAAPAMGNYRSEQVVKEIHFALDSARLNGEARTVLNEVLELMLANPASNATLTGHTCNLASNDYNDRLAARRAQTALTYLVNHGIDADRIAVSSYGEERPKYDNSQEATRRNNRRVEINVSIPAIDPPTVSINVEPSSIELGESAQLSWTSSNANSIMIEGLAPGQPLTGSQTITPAENTTYRANAVGDGGEASDRTSIRVRVPSGPTVRSVYTSVIAPDGNFITDLDMANFGVTEGGVSKRIVNVTFEVQGFPSQVALVLDESASMASAMHDLKLAASRFIEHKKENDEVLVMGFSSDIKVHSDFDADPEASLAAIAKLRPRSTTHLYDALFEIATEMADVTPPRIVLLMTDGVDEGGIGQEQGSSHSFDEALAMARANALTVFTIGLGNKLDPAILDRIADETGGAAYYTTESSELADIYNKLSRGLLQGQYRIDYETTIESTGSVGVTSETGRVVGVTR